MEHVYMHEKINKILQSIKSLRIKSYNSATKTKEYLEFGYGQIDVNDNIKISYNEFLVGFKNNDRNQPEFATEYRVGLSNKSNYYNVFDVVEYDKGKLLINNFQEGIWLDELYVKGLLTSQELKEQYDIDNQENQLKLIQSKRKSD